MLDNPPHDFAGASPPDLSDLDFRVRKVLAGLHPHDRPEVAVLAAQMRGSIEAGWALAADRAAEVERLRGGSRP